MVKHVLFCKLDEYSEENVKALVDVFMSMKGKVPCAREVFAAADFLRSGRSYDVMLEVTLDSKEALEEYQKDEYHVNVVKKYVHARVHQSATVDYEY